MEVNEFDSEKESDLPETKVLANHKTTRGNNFLLRNIRRQRTAKDIQHTLRQILAPPA